jgi:hypothetical protein
LALVESRFGKHQTLAQAQRRFKWLFDQIDPDKLLVFGVLRNPVDYVVSLYNSHMDPKFQGEPRLYTGQLTFDQFLLDWCERNAEQARQQHTRFLDGQGNLGVNYLIDYGDLTAGLRFVADRIGVPDLGMLPRENASYGKMKADSLSAEQRQWIETRFAGDRELLAKYCNRVLPEPPKFAASGVSRSDDEKITSEQFVKAAYRALLLRWPDKRGFALRLGQLQSGVLPEVVLRELLRSPEFSRKLPLFVQTYLGASFSAGAEQLEPNKDSIEPVVDAPLGDLEPIPGASAAQNRRDTPAVVGERPKSVMKPNLAALEATAASADTERLIFVHSHRRSGTHFLLDVLRTWFDVPLGIEHIPGPTELRRYAAGTLSKDHEPHRGFKLSQDRLWGSQRMRECFRALYEAGSHIYVVRNPLDVLRSLYVFDVSGAEGRFMVNSGTTFSEYLTGRSLHEQSGSLTRVEYWVRHVRSWYPDDKTLVVHYDDLKDALPETLAAISRHIGMPIRASARAVDATGIGSNLTSRFIAEGGVAFWDSYLIGVLRTTLDRMQGSEPIAGLNDRLEQWLDEFAVKHQSG